MEAIHTLSDLLRGSGCDYAIYDLGRRLTPISHQQFINIEAGNAPYPYPLQRKAHLAIAYWNKTQQPWIWFLKFELDERGLLQPGDIGNFIKYVVEAMGSRLSAELSEAQQQSLANNPYTYKPSDDKLAMFHSQIRASLTLPASAYYEHAQHYFTGELGWDNWQTVGLQGICDLASRLDQEQNTLLLRKALRHLPNEPRYALLGALEHARLSESLIQRITELTLDEMNQSETDLFLLAAYLRALSNGSAAASKPLLEKILTSPSFSHPEVLIAIAGRCWHWLADAEMAEMYLIRLAETGNANLFKQVFADLVMLPELRLILLPLLHSSPSTALNNALLSLQQTARG